MQKHDTVSILKFGFVNSVDNIKYIHMTSDFHYEACCFQSLSLFFIVNFATHKCLKPLLLRNNFQFWKWKLTYCICNWWIRGILYDTESIIGKPYFELRLVNSLGCIKCNHVHFQRTISLPQQKILLLGSEEGPSYSRVCKRR